MISCDSGLPKKTRNFAGNSQNFFWRFTCTRKAISILLSTSQNFWHHLLATGDQVTPEVPWDVESETRTADFNNASSTCWESEDLGYSVSHWRNFQHRLFDSVRIIQPGIFCIILQETDSKNCVMEAPRHTISELHYQLTSCCCSRGHQCRTTDTVFAILSFSPSFLLYLLIFVCLLIFYLSSHLPSHLSLSSQLSFSPLISDVSLSSHSSQFFGCVCCCWCCVLLYVLLCSCTEDNTERSCIHVCRQNVRVFWDTGVLTAHMYAFWKNTRERLGRTVTDTQTPLTWHTHLSRDTSNFEQTHHQKGSSTCLLLFIYISVFLLSLSSWLSLLLLSVSFHLFLSLFNDNDKDRQVGSLYTRLWPTLSARVRRPWPIRLLALCLFRYSCACADHTSPYARMHTCSRCVPHFAQLHPMHLHWLKMFERFCVYKIIPSEHHVTSGCSWVLCVPSYLLFVYHDTDWNQTEPVRDSAWSGPSRHLGDPTPSTDYEPKFCIDVSSKHMGKWHDNRRLRGPQFASTFRGIEQQPAYGSKHSSHCVEAKFIR